MTTSDEIEADKCCEQPGLVRLVLFFVMQGVAVIMVGFAALFLSFEPAWSTERVHAAFVKPGEARSGSLLLKTEEGFADASRLGIDIDLTVSGPTVRARVTQIFRNPTQDWVEAVYVYPLPSGGAVDTLKMVIGDRVVVGDIRERQQAKIIYEQAKQNGQKAALTEQERPNIFTNSVANIGPGETVLVQIEYQEPVAQSGNEFSLRVPMVVAPRYNPAPVVQSVDFRADGGGWGSAKSDPVPDRDRIAPEVLDPRDQRSGQPDTHHRAAAGRLPARRDQEPPSRDQDRRTRRRHAHSAPCRRPGAGRPRFRADLEAGCREGALGRIVPRARRRQRLFARLRHTAVDRAGAAEAIAARSHLRDRQFRLDGWRLDHPGQGEPHLRAWPPAAERPLQRDPVRPHHGCVIPGGRAGRQGAYRPGHLVCRRIAGQWRH